MSGRSAVRPMLRGQSAVNAAVRWKGREVGGEWTEPRHWVTKQTEKISVSSASCSNATNLAATRNHTGSHRVRRRDLGTTPLCRHRGRQCMCHGGRWGPWLRPQRLLHKRLLSLG